jgi:hypothetical protein
VVNAWEVRGRNKKKGANKIAPLRNLNINFF